MKAAATRTRKKKFLSPKKVKPKTPRCKSKSPGKPRKEYPKIAPSASSKSTSSKSPTTKSALTSVDSLVGLDMVCIQSAPVNTHAVRVNESTTQAPTSQVTITQIYFDLSDSFP